MSISNRDNKNTNTPDLSVNIGGVEFKNPVMTGSGTFGSGKEYSEFIDLNRLGGVVCKGVASEPWNGNPSPRIAETYGGIINAVGLQNPGVAAYIENDIPFLKNYDTKIIANLAGRTIEEYCDVTEKLNDSGVDMMELNISCPNVKEGGVAFGTDPSMAAEITAAVRKVCKTPLIVKLSPNVTDITEIARAVEGAGADAISLINTLLGMRIDINRKRPVIHRNVGGYSGPAIKPVALRMVYQCAKAVQVPLIGMGGICNAADAIEFILAGATGVAIGSASFSNPTATIEVIDGIEEYMLQQGFTCIADIQAAFLEN